jgi:hypothetical protein
MAARARIDREQIMSEDWSIVKLAAGGQLRDKEIAAVVGVDLGRVRGVKQSELGRERIEQLKARSHQVVQESGVRISNLTEQAVDVFEDVLSGGDEVPIRVKVDVAKSTMDRAGLGPVQRVKGQSLNVFLTRADIEQIKAEVRREQTEQAEVADVEVIDVAVEEE